MGPRLFTEINMVNIEYPSHPRRHSECVITDAYRDLWGQFANTCHAPERLTQCFHCSICTCMPRARKINALFPLFDLHMHATHQKDQRNFSTVQSALITRCHSHMMRQNKPPQKSCCVCLINVWNKGLTRIYWALC